MSDVRSAQLVAVRPEGVAAAGIDHQRDVRADRLARTAHDRLVHGRAHPPERAPAELERPEAVGQEPFELRGERVRLAHQDRGVRPDALGVPAAQQPADRLAGRLAEQVPQRDVDGADGMGQRPAAPEPERVLVEDLGRPLGFDGGRAAVERLELGERRPDEVDVGERAAVADRALLGDDRDERVDRILGPELLAPAAFGRRPVQADGADLADPHATVSATAGRTP